MDHTQTEPTPHPVRAILDSFSRSHVAPYYPQPGLPLAALLLAKSHGVPPAVETKELPLLHLLARHTPNPNDASQEASMQELAALLIAGGADPLEQRPWQQETVDALDLALLSGNLGVLRAALPTIGVSPADLAARVCAPIWNIAWPGQAKKNIPWLHVLAAEKTPNAAEILQFLIHGGAEAGLTVSHRHSLAMASVPVIKMYRQSGWFPADPAVAATLEKPWRQRLVFDGGNKELAEQIDILRHATRAPSGAGASPNVEAVDVEYDAAVKSMLAAPLGNRYATSAFNRIARADPLLDKATVVVSGGLAGTWNTVAAMCCAALRGYSERDIMHSGYLDQSPFSFLKKFFDAGTLDAAGLEKQMRQHWRKDLPFSGILALAVAAAIPADTLAANNQAIDVRIFGKLAEDDFIVEQAPAMCDWLLAMPVSASLATAGTLALLRVSRALLKRRPGCCLDACIPMEKLALTFERLIGSLHVHMYAVSTATASLINACVGPPDLRSLRSRSGQNALWHADILLSAMLARDLPADQRSPSQKIEAAQMMDLIDKHPVWNEKDPALLDRWEQRVRTRCSGDAWEPLLARLSAQSLRRRVDSDPPASKARRMSL